MSEQQQIPRTSLLAPFVLMLQAGVPCATLIDVGSADGTYSLEFLAVIAGGAKLFNVDPNPVYAPSLERIAAELGGGYRICALASFNGTAVLSSGPHEYWSTLGGDAAAGTRVECRTLDSLCAEHALGGPFFVKMDVEGAELSVLLGAEKTLDNAAGLLLESNVYYGPHSGGRFVDLCGFLAARGFSLFDVVGFGYRAHDGVLFQLYSAFLHQRYEFRHRTGSVEGADAQAQLTATMRARRQVLLERNEALLTTLRAARQAS